jgi:hypothetical protein
MDGVVIVVVDCKVVEAVEQESMFVVVERVAVVVELVHILVVGVEVVEQAVVAGELVHMFVVGVVEQVGVEVEVEVQVVVVVEQEHILVVVERVAVVVEPVHMLGVEVAEQGVVAGVEEVLLGERIVEHSFVELDTMEKHFWAKQELQLLAEFQNSLH